ncbi:MAG: hypothetical protein WA913_04255 [Pricia sp.]
MEEELLKELDSILNPAINRSWGQATRLKSFGGDPRTAFLDNLKIEMDHAKVDLSKITYKMDLAMQGHSTDVERAAAEMETCTGPELPEVNSSDYVREINDGFEVWDGIKWVPLSKKANIKLEVFANPERDNSPAVKVWASDESLKTSVVFIDNDLHAPGWDVGYTSMGEHFDEIPNFIPRNAYWEDPFYGTVKTSAGLFGRTAGALGMRHLGNMSPWRTADALRNAEGWYRNKEGVLQNLNKQRGIGAGGYQKSVRRAARNASKFRSVGKKFFYVGAAMSVVDGGLALHRNDYNKNEVLTKAAVDIFIGAVGVWGGPIGWAISGTYFVLDVSGAFGDWGRPTGLSRYHYEQNIRKSVLQNYGFQIRSLEFEIDYITPVEKSQRAHFLEERAVKRDNTNVVLPKLIFEKISQ